MSNKFQRRTLTIIFFVNFCWQSTTWKRYPNFFKFKSISILAIRSKDDGKNFSYLITVLSNKIGIQLMRKTRRWHSPFNCSKYLRSQVREKVCATRPQSNMSNLFRKSYQIQSRSKVLLLVCLLIAREIFPPRIVRLFTVHKFSPLLIILHHCLRLLDTVFKVRPRLLYMEKGWPAQPNYPGQANSSIKSWRCEPLTSEKKRWLG